MVERRGAYHDLSQAQTHRLRFDCELMRAAELELSRALRGPHDRTLLLAWADLLIERGDPRGEQLILEDRAEHGEGPSWRSDAEQVLALTAERGFVALPEDDDATLLPWEGGGSYPVQYQVEHQGHAYYARYRHHSFTVECDQVEVVQTSLNLLESGTWTMEETNFFLHLVSDAIRDGRLGALVFPSAEERDKDPRHRLGALPRFVLPDSFARWSIRARDYGRWYALHSRWKHV